MLTLSAASAQALDAFTDTGIVDDFGRVFSGREDIAQWSEREFIGANGTLTPETVSIDDDAIRIVADWRSSRANGRTLFSFVVDGDRLAAMVIREG